VKANETKNKAKKRNESTITDMCCRGE